jgi:hypothetical protein
MNLTSGCWAAASIGNKPKNKTQKIAQLGFKGAPSFQQEVG